MDTEDLVRRIKNEWLKEYKRFIDSADNIIIFGASNYGNTVYKILSEFKMNEKIVSFCDNDSKKWGIKLDNGLTTESYETIKKTYRNRAFIICSTYEGEIRNQLGDELFFIRTRLLKFLDYFMICTIYNKNECSICGDFIEFSQKCKRLYFNNDFDYKINRIYEMLSDNESKYILENRIKFLQTDELEYWNNVLKYYNENEYFGNYYNISTNETFVDCGAYNGDSVKDFINYVNNNYKKIIAIEPDKSSFIQLEEFARNNENIEVFNYATGNETKTVRFEDSNSFASHISEDGSQEIKLDKLDNILREEEEITFVKMDIEGAELETLKGTVELIKKHKPKLAICIYHKPEDIYEIPLFINSIVPEYRFTIRQHHEYICDTVLYAEII